MQRFSRFVGVVALLAMAAAPYAAHAYVDLASDTASDDSSALALRALPALTPAEQTVLDLTNADRARAGLPPVTFDPATLDVARTRASQQLGKSDLSHYDASGQLTFVTLLTNGGVDYHLAGENLARGTGSSTDAAFLGRIDQALMQSPTHRKNILEPSFNHLAVGVATDASGRVALAQIFRAAE